METVPSSGTSSSSTSLYFPQFNEFHEDIRKLIISFVADAPFEKNVRHVGSLNNKKTGSITHVLPLVNKEFYTFTKLDYFWEPILKRQLFSKRHDMDHSRVWKDGLHRLLSEEELAAVHTTVDEYKIAHETAAVSDDIVEKYKQIIVTSGVRDAARDVILEKMMETQKLLEAGTFERTATLIQILDRSRRRTTSCKTIYKTVCTTQLFFEAPMFIMPCTLELGVSYGLHLFEPRYRIMMHDLLQEKCADPVRAGTGKTPIVSGRDPTTGILNPPLLLHACSPSHTIDVGSTVCLVQLVWSKIYEDGTADVRLLPVAWVDIDQVLIRREAGDLFYANVFRN